MAVAAPASLWPTREKSQKSSDRDGRGVCVYGRVVKEGEQVPARQMFQENPHVPPGTMLGIFPKSLIPTLKL